MKRSRFPLLLLFLPGLLSAEVMLQNGVLIDRTLSTSGEETATGQALEKDPAGDDLVLFNNGNALHGSFAGLQDGVLWERADIDRPIRFARDNIRQIIMKHRPSLAMGPDTSFCELVSGDRIPGKILSLDDTTLSLDSAVLGKIDIPRSFSLGW